MNAIDILILAALALVVFLALRAAGKSRAKGCGGCCASCRQNCGKTVDKARKDD